MPLVPDFLLPGWLREAPTIVKFALLVPLLIVGAIIGIAVNAILINVGGGNQHLSTSQGGFEAWLIWIIVGIGLFIGLGIGAFVYIGVGLGADLEPEDEDEHQGESGLLET